MSWRPIATAPYSATPVWIRTDRGHELKAWWEAGGFEDEDGACGGWVAVDEDGYPDCWTDGVCWASNDAEVPSDQPAFWRPIVGAVRRSPSEASAGNEARDEQKTDPLQPQEPHS